MNKQARCLAAPVLWLLAAVVHAGTVTYIHTGSALKDDIFHMAATFKRADAAENGARFRLVGGDDRVRTLFQLKGDLNGVPGRYEYIVDQGQLTHQRFVPHGSLNGVPNKP